MSKSRFVLDTSFLALLARQINTTNEKHTDKLDTKDKQMQALSEEVD